MPLEFSANISKLPSLLSLCKLSKVFNALTFNTLTRVAVPVLAVAAVAMTAVFSVAPAAGQSNSVNAPPVITVPGDKTYEQGEEITPFGITVSDADKDPLTVTLTGLPSGLSYTSDQVQGTVAANAAAKDYTVTITADDEVNTAVTETFTITVNEAKAQNAPPVITAPGVKTYEQGEQITAFGITVSDADSDPLPVTLTGLPSGLSYTSDQVQGTVAANAAAQDYTVTITADDGVNTAVTETFTITVTEPAPTNAPPEITSPGDKTFEQGETITAFGVTVTDADGDEVTVTLTGLPLGLLFDEDEGQVQGTVSAVGAAYPVKITADDGVNAAVTETFTITVTLNAPPEITAPGDKTFEQGEEITAFGITVTDADTVTVTLTGLPSGLTYTNDQVQGTVAANAAAQDYTVTISADDGVNAAVEETFTITVTEPASSNAPPEITAPGDKTYEQGEEITAFDITVTDADQDTLTVTLTGLPSGLSYTSDQVQGTVAANAAAQDYTVTVSADDGVSAAVTETFTITVTPNSNRPTVVISGPTSVQNGAFTVNIDFSESVTGFEQADVTVGNGKVTGFAGEDGRSILAIITPAATGTVTLDVAAHVAVDNDGYGNLAATQYSVEADLGEPTVTISCPTGVQTGAFTVDIDFSESVTGFEQADVTVGNGKVTGFAGEGGSILAIITPVATGTVTLDVAANVAVDNDGYGNTAAQQCSVQAALTSAPAVTIEDASASEGDSLTFTVTLDKAVSGGLTVTPSFTDGTAAKGTDYTENTAAISFTGNAGETQTFTVATTEDEVVEAAETFTVNLTVSGTSVTATDTATGTITNDDTATVTVEDVSGAEGGPGFSFVVNGNLYTGVALTATLDKAVQGGFQLALDASAGTATKSLGATHFSTTDFTANPVSLRFDGNAGERQSLVRNWVSIHQDEVVEETETFRISYLLAPLHVSGPRPPVPDGVTIDGPATGTIIDDDSATVTIADASAVEGDAITFTATLDKAVSGGLTVTPSFTDMTATSGTDYTENTAAITFTGTAGETQTFTVATTDDTDEETDETFTVSLSLSGTSLAVTATDTAAGTILDDDGEASNALPVITSPGDKTYEQGAAITPFGITVTDADSDTVTVTVTGLPSGLSYANDQVQGTVSADATAQDYTVTISADDGVNDAVTATFTITVASVEPYRLDGPAGPLKTYDPFDLTIHGGLSGTAYLYHEDSVAQRVRQRLLRMTPVRKGRDQRGTAPFVVRVLVHPLNQRQSRLTGEYRVTVDPDPPRVDISGPQQVQNGPFEVTFTVSEENVHYRSGVKASGVDGGFKEDRIVVTNGSVTSFSGDWRTYVAQITPAESGVVAVEVPAGVLRDHVGWVNQAASYEVQADLDPPDLNIGGVPATIDNQEPLTVTFEFPEPVTGFETGDIAVQHGNLGTLTGSGTTRSAQVTPTGSGDLTVRVVAGAALDAAQNAGPETAVTAVARWTGAAPHESNAPPVITAPGDKTYAQGKTITPFGIAVADAQDDSVTVTVTGLPSGLSYANDQVQGTVAADAAAQGYTVTISADDGVNDAVTATFTITVTANAPPVITAPGDKTYEQGETITPFGITVSDADGDTVTVTLTGLPSGLSYANNQVQGTVAADAAAQDYTVTVSADDGVNPAVTETFTITVIEPATKNAPPVITAPGDKTYEQGETITPFGITVTDADGDTVTVTLAGLPSGLSYTSGQVRGTVSADAAAQAYTVTIAANDGVNDAEAAVFFQIAVTAPTPAVVTVADASADEGDLLTFTVTLDKEVQGGLTVTPSFTDGTATKVTDYTENTAPLTFAGTAGETETFTVATTEDNDDETNETFTVSLTVAGTSATITATDTATGTITDDDDDRPIVTIADTIATEGEDLTFTLTLDKAVPESFSVTTKSVAGLIVTAGVDYTDQTQAVQFAGTAGEQHTITIATASDETVEPDETLYVNVYLLEDLSDMVRTGTQATGTIVDDDESTVTIADASATEGNTLTFIAKLENAVQGGVGVTPVFTDGTAFANLDYHGNTEEIRFTNADEQHTFTARTIQENEVEGDETFEVSLRLSEDALAGLRVGEPATGTIIDDDGEATNAPPVITVPGDKTYEQGETIPSFGITVADADAVAQDYTVTITADDAVNAAVTETFTITVTAAEPQVTIADAAAEEGDPLTFAVTLNKAVADGLTVTPSFTDGTAAEGTDYTENTDAIMFTGTAGEARTFTVATIEDDDDETDETFTVSLEVSGTLETVTATDTVTGTITDDDESQESRAPPLPEAVTISNADAVEGEALTFTVTLNRAVQGGLTVTPSFSDGTAAADSDYTPNTAPLSFTGTLGEQQTITVETVEDAVLEADETFTVSLGVSGALSGVTVGDPATGTITDDDDGTTGGTAAVTISNADAVEGEALTFTVTLNRAVQGGLTVTPSFSDGTAAADRDYTPNTAPLSFTGTLGEQQTITVETVEDAVLEADETFTVSLGVSGAPSEVTVGGPATGTITDDDGGAIGGSATVTISNADAVEGEALTFTVTLNRAVQGGLTVTPSFSDGTAAADRDYTPNTAALSFTGTLGEQRTIPVATIEDAVVEADETFTVSLDVSDALSGVTVGAAATGTIEDDDGTTGGTAAVTISNADAVEGEALTFTVTLNRVVEDGLTVTPRFTDGTAAQGADYTPNTAALRFSGTAGEQQTITVETVEDAVLEADETFTVSLGVSGAPSGVTVGGPATGTITDDDGGAIGGSATVTISNADAVEGEALTFTVTLNRAVQGGLTVTPSFSDGTAAADRDYTPNTAALSFTGTLGEQRTIPVATIEDAAVEGDETFTVSLGVSGAPSGVTVGGPATGTITDDDGGAIGGSATVTISNARAAEGEALSFTVTLNRAVQGGLTMTPRFTDGTATQGADYTPNTAALSFTGTAGEQQTFRVLTIEDAVVEEDETFTVSLDVSDAPQGVTVSAPATGTITDDDGGTIGGSATVTIANASAVEGEALTFIVTLNQAVSGGLTVTPRFTDGAATEGVDYRANPAPLRFTGAAGERRTFTVETIEDAVAEGDETFTVSLDMTGAPAGLTAGAPATGTITDDDDGAIGGGRGANNAPNAEDDYITVSRGDTTTTLSNGNSAAQLKNQTIDPFGPPEDFLDDADDPGDERSDLAILLETSVLANDSDFEDDIGRLSVELVDGTSHGDLTLNRDGTFVYVHDGSEVAEDRFTYRVKDSSGALSEVAEVTITIVEVNAAANAVPAAEMIPDQILLLGKDGMVNLSNYFTDPDGDPLSYQARASDGSSTVRVNVSSSEVILTPVAVNATRVTVTARDPGGLSVEQTFGVTVESASGRNDRLLEFSLAAFGRTVASQAVDAIGGRFDASPREPGASVGGQGLDFESASDEQGRPERFLQAVGTFLAGRGCHPGSRFLAGTAAGRLAPVQASSAGWPAGAQTGFSGGGLAGVNGAGGFSGGGCRAGVNGAGGFSGGGLAGVNGARGFSGGGSGGGLRRRGRVRSRLPRHRGRTDRQAWLRPSPRPGSDDGQFLPVGVGSRRLGRRQPAARRAGRRLDAVGPGSAQRLLRSSSVGLGLGRPGGCGLPGGGPPLGIEGGGGCGRLS